MSNFIDMKTFDEIKNIMGDKISLLVESFLEDGEGYIKEIKSGDLKRAQPAAHTIKSSSSQIGAFKLSDIAKEIEEKCRDKNIEAVKGLTGSIVDAFNEVKSELKGKGF